MSLDGVDQATGLALRGDQVVPASGGHVRTLTHTGHPRRDGIGAVEVVEQPPVEAVRAEGGLHGGHVEGHCV